MTYVDYCRLQQGTATRPVRMRMPRTYIIEVPISGRIQKELVYDDEDEIEDEDEGVEEGSGAAPEDVNCIDDVDVDGIQIVSEGVDA